MIVLRERNQQGSLQARSHGKRKMWVWLYRQNGSRKYVTLGPVHKMTKAQAEKKRDEVLAEFRAQLTDVPNPDITFGQFFDGVALPFYRSKWKSSTASTTESRMTHHLAEFAKTPLKAITLKTLQAFLGRKAASDLSRSTVSHLRWDLRAIFKLAVAEGYTQRDPSIALYIPKEAVTEPTRAMTAKEVEPYIAALSTRERVIASLAIFAGMRPGEILGLQRQHMSEDCTEVTISQRLYRGDIDTPKTNSSRRIVAIPPMTAALLKKWMELVKEQPEAWVFESENPKKPVWRDNIWYRHMKPKLDVIGLGWANFQALRRTHASLGHKAGIDPKVSADQRGHGIGVALDVYTKAALSTRAEAAKQLEESILAA
jgi:integrase